MSHVQIWQSDRAFTLTEIMVTLLILTVLCVSIMSSLIVASRSTRSNTDALVTRNVAQSFYEQMISDDFANVGPANYNSTIYGVENPVWIDHASGRQCTIEFSFKGYGTLQGGSNRTMVDINADWVADEWAGQYFYVVEGIGVGEFSRIESNSKQSLMLEEPLFSNPDANSKYMINNGKTVEMRVTWNSRGRESTHTYRNLVLNSRGEPLGF